MHLLIQNNVIVSMIVIDGDEDSGGVSASVQIARSLSVIDGLYGTEWNSTAWVVMHWDSDHHYGMYNILTGGDSQRGGGMPYFRPGARLYSGAKPPNPKELGKPFKCPYTNIQDELVSLRHHGLMSPSMLTSISGEAGVCASNLQLR